MSYAVKIDSNRLAPGIAMVEIEHVLDFFAQQLYYQASGKANPVPKTIQKDNFTPYCSVPIAADSCL